MEKKDSFENAKEILPECVIGAKQNKMIAHKCPSFAVINYLLSLGNRFVTSVVTSRAASASASFSRGLRVQNLGSFLLVVLSASMDSWTLML